MSFYYHLSLLIHITTAMFWLGGMLFFVAVIIPISRKKMYEKFRSSLINQIGTRFSRMSWGAFGLLLITGITNLLTKGFSLSDLVTAQFWKSGYGSTLHTKLHFFILMLILSAVHDFYIGPKATELMEQQPGTSKTQKYRKTAGWLGRINLVLGFVIVFYAIKLSRG